MNIHKYILLPTYENGRAFHLFKMKLSVHQAVVAYGMGV